MYLLPRKGLSLAVAKLVLGGEIAYHAGNFELAFKLLRQAVDADSALPYDEPWGWMMPPAHPLGGKLQHLEV